MTSASPPAHSTILELFLTHVKLYSEIYGSKSNGEENVGFVLFCWLVASRYSNMRVYLRDGSAQTIFTCCHIEIELADPKFYLTQSQYTDTGPTSPSADPITPGTWQGSHWSANV